MFERVERTLAQVVEDCLDVLKTLPQPETEAQVQQRLRTAVGFARAMQAIRKATGGDDGGGAPREDDEDGDMEDPADPEALERKHRTIDEGLARMAAHLVARDAAAAVHARQGGGRQSQLENESQPRAA